MEAPICSVFSSCSISMGPSGRELMIAEYFGSTLRPTLCIHVFAERHDESLGAFPSRTCAADGLHRFPTNEYSPFSSRAAVTSRCNHTALMTTLSLSWPARTLRAPPCCLAGPPALISVNCVRRAVEARPRGLYSILPVANNVKRGLG